MATRHDVGAPPAKRKLTTYGKSSKKPATIIRPPRPSQEVARATDRAAALQQSKIATMRQPQIATSSSTTTTTAELDDSSPEPLSLDGPTDLKLPAPSVGKGATTEKKRKISQIYSGIEQGQDPLSEDSSPSAPKPRRSRVSSPSDHLGAKGKAAAAARRMPSAPTDAMDIDTVDGALSSPPPTPTPHKDRKPNGKDVSKKTHPFSPNTYEILDALHVSDDKKKQRQHQIPVRLATEQLPKPKAPTTLGSASRTTPRPTTKPPTSVSNPNKKPRRKLIDALVEQMEESDEPAVEDKAESQASWNEPPTSSSQPSQGSAADSQSSPSQTPKPRRPNGNIRTFSRGGSSLKFTYGQSKLTMLEEDNLLEAMIVPDDTDSAPKARRLELGGPKKLPKLGLGFDDDDTSGASPKAKMRDIHELKQAGKNNRDADDMIDLSDQIGLPSATPSSSRRAALLQAAEKMRQKEYRQHLRDYGVEAMIFRDIGSETDPVSGYLVASILLHILANSSAPHILRLLREQDAGSFFARLIGLDEDLKRLARDRKSNLSKRSQAALIAIQAGLLDLPCWNSTRPIAASPRTVALKCLDILISQDVDIGSEPMIFPASVTNNLFMVLSAAKEPEFWDDPSAAETFDVRCALSVLEFHAVKAMESHGDSEQFTAQYLPVVADAFGAALENPAARNSELEGLLLKLVLNMTNSSATAPDTFVAKGIMPVLSSSVCTSFSQALATVSGDGWAEDILNGLVLRLGILINFAEQSMPVRRAVFESPGDNSSPMQELIQLFLANHRATADVSKILNPKTCTTVD